MSERGEKDSDTDQENPEGSRKDKRVDLKKKAQVEIKGKIIKALEDIYKYHLKLDKRRSISLFYHHHNK